jgi:hypothetical protein
MLYSVYWRYISYEFDSPAARPPKRIVSTYKKCYPTVFVLSILGITVILSRINTHGTLPGFHRWGAISFIVASHEMEKQSLKSCGTISLK